MQRLTGREIAYTTVCHGCRKAEEALDAAHNRLLKKLDVTGKAKLKAAQVAWLQFREANASFSADTARGGTMAPLIALSVSTEMAENRTAELEKLLQHR